MTNSRTPRLSLLHLGVLVFAALIQGLIAVEPLSVPDLVAAGNSLMNQEKWKEAMKPFQTAINQHSKKHRSEKAEANYKIGVCLEKLGKNEDAALAYLSVVAVYGAEVDWSSRALESRIAIVSQPGNTDDPAAEYKFARRNSVVILRNVRDNELPEALQRVLGTLPQIAEKLKLTPEQVLRVDRELGIEPENRAHTSHDRAGVEMTFLIRPMIPQSTRAIRQG